jgi:hypothetical protein|nr:MAG TPA: hypothetical protein [Caudoviricetes sp.]
MTTYELYINDILCDLSSDEVITLLYQSPIFSSLDSIQSNRSYNIALPPTPANMRAIGQAARPDVDADAPYVRLPAALYQDGVPLFTQGFAVVTDIADTINVTLTWGNADNFQPLFDANLRDLTIYIPAPEGAEGDWVSYIEWNENTQLLDSTGEEPDAAFWAINFGMGLSNPKYLHPSVPVSSILGYIEEYNGITIDGKDRLAYSPHGGPIIPLVSKNGDEISNKAEAFTFSAALTTLKDDQIQGVIGWSSVIQDPQGIAYGRCTAKFDKGNRKVRISMTPSNGANTFTINVGTYLPASEITGFAIVVLVWKEDISDWEVLQPIAEASSFSNVGGGGDYLTYTATFYPFETSFEIFENTEIAFHIVAYGGLIYNNNSISNAPTVRVWTDWEDCAFPTKYPIGPNLPDISQGDFILAMMNMQGLFAYADKNSPNTIKLISIDDIIANVQKNDIIDWSDRVILNDIHRVDMPDASVFTIDDLAQSNILDYDNDDDVKTDTHGTITIRNENIEKEAELVELPFSASENENTAGLDRPCALVPIYEDDSKGGANYSECSPRILSVRGGYYNTIDIKAIGVFDPWMKFGGDGGIVKTRYASYQKVVDRLRIITIRAKLTALDLYNLDYTKPVYIAQFGLIFAIYSVETGEDGICDCQLLKLKVDGVVPVHYYLYLDGQNADQSKTDITSAGTTITYSVQSNGTPYVVSKDSRLTATLQTAEDGTMLLTIKVPQNTSDADIDYDPVILGVGEAYWVNRKVSISQLRAGYGVNLLNDSESITFDTEGGVWGKFRSVSTEMFEGYKCAVVRNPKLRVLNGAFCQLGKFDDNQIAEGSSYMASAYVWANEPVGIRIGLENSEGFVFIIDSTMTGKWIRLSSYQKAMKYNPAFVLYANPTTSTTVVAFRMAQLERGDKLTEWKESIADQQKKQYYLTLNGSAGDISINIEAAAKQNRVSWSSNGTPQILSYSGDAVALAEVDAYAVNIYSYANTTSEQRTGQVTVYLKEAPSIERKIVVIQEAAAAERMVIIDVHACGVEAGDNIELMFELTTSWLGWFDVLDDLTVRVSFEELSSMMGQELADHVGERFYIEASNNGECWFGPVPASGNIEAELV